MACRPIQIISRSPARPFSATANAMHPRGSQSVPLRQPRVLTRVRCRRPGRAVEDAELEQAGVDAVLRVRIERRLAPSFAEQHGEGDAVGKCGPPDAGHHVLLAALLACDAFLAGEAAARLSGGWGAGPENEKSQHEAGGSDTYSEEPPTGLTPRPRGLGWR
jgi:hypothetical protein